MAICIKIAYNDKKQAISAIRVIQSRGVQKKYTPRRAYQCDDCGKWHITHYGLEHYLVYKSESIKLNHYEEWKKLM